MTTRFNVTLSADEARLIREPEDKAVLDRLIKAAMNCAYTSGLKDGAEHMTAAWPGVIRGIVEGLAAGGNPHAVAALLFESRLTEKATPEKAPTPVVAALAWPEDPLRVEVVGVPPAEPKVITFTRGLDGKIAGAASDGR